MLCWSAVGLHGPLKRVIGPLSPSLSAQAAGGLLQAPSALHTCSSKFDSSVQRHCSISTQALCQVFQTRGGQSAVHSDKMLLIYCFHQQMNEQRETEKKRNVWKVAVAEMKCQTGSQMNWPIVVNYQIYTSPGALAIWHLLGTLERKRLWATALRQKSIPLGWNGYHFHMLLLPWPNMRQRRSLLHTKHRPIWKPRRNWKGSRFPSPRIKLTHSSGHVIFSSRPKGSEVKYRNARGGEAEDGVLSACCLTIRQVFLLPALRLCPWRPWVCDCASHTMWASQGSRRGHDPLWQNYHHTQSALRGADQAL